MLARKPQTERVSEPPTTSDGSHDTWSHLQRHDVSRHDVVDITKTSPLCIPLAKMGANSERSRVDRDARRNKPATPPGSRMKTTRFAAHSEPVSQFDELTDKVRSRSSPTEEAE